MFQRMISCFAPTCARANVVVTQLQLEAAKACVAAAVTRVAQMRKQAAAVTPDVTAETEERFKGKPRYVSVHCIRGGVEHVYDMCALVCTHKISLTPVAVGLETARD